MRQIICVYLPSLPIDLAFRRERPLRDKPLVLIDNLGSRETVVYSSPSAQAFGISDGMALAVARSRCSELVVRPFDLQHVERGYETLARWMIQYSPVVAIEAPAIIAEIGGSERAIGSVRSITQEIKRRLSASGVTASIAIASTTGAAWALAMTGNNVIGDEVMTSLAPLPVIALRISRETATSLHQVGIETIGQLVRFPRTDLHARFGNELLLRIDQALGVIPEPIISYTEVDPISACIESEEPVTSTEAIWQAMHDLTEQIANELSGRNQGVCKLRISLRPAYSPAIEKVLTFSRPSRDVKNIDRLICLALEHLQAREGFVSIQLDVLRAQKINQTQRDYVGDPQADQRSELEDLADGLQARLGRDAVLCPKFVESYVPERACTWTPWPAVSSAVTITAPRPLQLDHPVEIGVVVSPSEDREGSPIAFRHRGESHQIKICVGPERISGQWWDGHHKTRDYFDVEDETGRRFWIFRVLESFKWYLHGTF